MDIYGHTWCDVCAIFVTYPTILCNSDILQDLTSYLTAPAYPP